MELVPAPGRVAQTHSFIIGALLLLFDLVQAIAHVYETEGALSATTVVVINLVMVFAANLTRMYQQQIAVTPEQKIEMVEAVLAAPVKAGTEDPQIKVRVNNPPELKA